MSGVLEELAMLEEAVAAVLRLHVPYKTIAPEGVVCEHCSTGNPFCTVSESWPCPTVSAIAGFVDVDKARGGG